MATALDTPRHDPTAREALWLVRDRSAPLGGAMHAAFARALAEGRFVSLVMADRVRRCMGEG